MTSFCSAPFDALQVFGDVMGLPVRALGEPEVAATPPLRETASEHVDGLSRDVPARIHLARVSKGAASGSLSDPVQREGPPVHKEAAGEPSLCPDEQPSGLTICRPWLRAANKEQT